MAMNEPINLIVERTLSKHEIRLFRTVRKNVEDAGFALDYDDGIDIVTGIGGHRRMWAYSFSWTNGLTTHVMVEEEGKEWAEIIGSFCLRFACWFAKEAV